MALWPIFRFVGPNNKQLEVVENNSAIEIRYGGSAAGWRDILGPIETRGVGATDPTWAVINAGPFSAHSFAIGDICWFSY